MKVTGNSPLIWWGPHCDATSWPIVLALGSPHPFGNTLVGNMMVWVSRAGLLNRDIELSSNAGYPWLCETKQNQKEMRYSKQEWQNHENVSAEKKPKVSRMCTSDTHSSQRETKHAVWDQVGQSWSNVCIDAGWLDTHLKKHHEHLTEWYTLYSKVELGLF